MLGSRRWISGFGRLVSRHWFGCLENTWLAELLQVVKGPGSVREFGMVDLCVGSGLRVMALLVR